MVRTRTDHIILWPSYFDSRNRRGSGRRVSRALAVEKPTVEDIFKALESLGFEATVHPDKSYPQRWWEHEGCVSVEKTASKAQLIKDVAEKLKAMNSQ